MWSNRCGFHGVVATSGLLLMVFYVLFEPTLILDGKDEFERNLSNSTDDDQWSFGQSNSTNEQNRTTGQSGVKATKNTTRSNQSDYDELTCKFPRLDPFDPSILKYVSHPRTFNCKRVQPDLTYMDDEGFLRVNTSEWDWVVKAHNSSFECIARTLDRSLGTTNNDNEVLYGHPERLELDYPLKLNGDIVSVECERDGKKFYRNIHAHPTTCGKRNFLDLDKAPEDQLSVHLIIIDSVSKSVLRRHLPSTYQYMTKEMGFNIFEGFNKVGDNSRPNVFPIITGMRSQYEQEGMPREIEDPWNYLDKTPGLIWNVFRRLNYSVMYNEDAAKWGTFNQYSKGFKHKPADFYYHSLWLAILGMLKKLGSSKYCFGNIPIPQFQFDLTRRHMKALKNKLQFFHTFAIETSHDKEADTERGDEIYASFLRDINTPEITNRSVIILMGDHGHRFGQIRKTLVGLIEERQPMFNIRFPPWFYDKYPHIRENVQSNTMRLTTPFDIHETLKDIAERNFNGQQRPWGTQGLSFLYPIPKNRTCIDAGIPDHHCTCTTNEQLATTNAFAISAGKHLTGYLNGITSNSSSWITNGAKCLPWVFKNVTRVERVGISSKAKAFDSKSGTLANEKRKNKLETGDKLRIAITMDPKDALFESELIYNGNMNSWSVPGQLSRLDQYGNQSWCVDHSEFRRYCICDTPANVAGVTLVLQALESNNTDNRIGSNST